MNIQQRKLQLKTVCECYKKKIEKIDPKLDSICNFSCHAISVVIEIFKVVLQVLLI